MKAAPGDDPAWRRLGLAFHQDWPLDLPPTLEAAMADVARATPPEDRAALVTILDRALAAPEGGALAGLWRRMEADVHPLRRDLRTWSAALRDALVETSTVAT